MVNAREFEGFEIRHESTYEYAITNGLNVSAQQADEALGAILYALNRNPTAFPVVAGANIRMAKLLARENDGLPAFRLFFRTNEHSSTVDLLYVDHG